MHSSRLVRLLREARRRRVFRTATIYAISAWLVLQVADVLLPGFDIPDSAIQTLFWAAIVGFPIALVFGWLFDIGADGIRRTLPAGREEVAEYLALQRTDYLILAALAVVVGLIVYRTTHSILKAPRAGSPPVTSESTPEVVTKLENSIAVLPFTNISNDPDNEFFCDGISEEILNRLGTIKGMNVIGRTSSFAFKGAGLSIPRLSSLLGVRFILQGSVRKYGDQLRISAQLINETGLQIWNQSFDREWKDVFALQSEIAEAVALKIVPQVNPTPPEEYLPDSAAYEHYLRGRQHLHARRVEAARAELERAIDIDPKFAEAHAELAILLLFGEPDQDQIDHSRRAIDTALSRKPDLLRAIAAQALYLSAANPPDLAGTEKMLREVLSRDPNMIDALNWYSGVLFQQGREEESREILERAARLDPYHPAIASNLSNALDQEGNFERAEELMLRLLELPEPGYIGFSVLGDLYQSHGQLVKMNQNAVQQLMRIDNPQYRSQASSYGLLGNLEMLEYWVERSRQDTPEFWSVPYYGVIMPFLEGRFRDVEKELQRVLAERDLEFAELQPFVQLWVGPALALAGDCENSNTRLEPVMRSDSVNAFTQALVPKETAINAWQIQAWCYARVGQKEKAARMLAELETEFSKLDTSDSRMSGMYLYYYSRNALLMGNGDLSMDRLERAIAAGWREYYFDRHDPLWDPVRDDPRYLKLMSEVKADIDAQRVEAERMAPPADVIARYDALVESRREVTDD